MMYGIGNGIVGVISFLLLPMYSVHLTPEDYGYLTIFTSFQAFLEIVISFGITSGLFRYFLMSESDQEREVVLNTCFFMQIFLMLIASLILLNPASLHLLSNGFFKSSDYSVHFGLVVLSSLLSALSSFFFGFTRVQKKAKFFVGMQFVKALLLLTINYFFVSVLQMKFYGIILGNLLALSLTTLGTCFWFAPFIKITFSAKVFRKVLFFTFPVVLLNSLNFILTFSDRFLISRFLSNEDVGLYSFSIKIASVLQLGMILPFSTAFPPYVFSLANDPSFGFKFSKIIKYFTILMFFLSAGLCIFSKEFFHVFANQRYASSHNLVGLFLLANIFNGLYYILSITFDIKEKTYISFFVILVGAIVSVCLNLILIPLLGTVGSAIALCLSNAFLVVSMYFLCQRNFPIPHELAAFFKLLIFYSFVLLISFWPASFFEIFFAQKIFLSVALVICAYFTSIFSIEEKKYFQLFTKNFFRTMFKKT